MPWKKDKEITNNIETENKSSHLIELVNITKTYGKDDPENGIEAVHALRWINFWIDDWAFISIMWPSWCGKSTLMNIVWLLDEPTSWDYLLRWEKVEAMTADERSMIRRTTIWFVFQWYNLLKRMSAREQVALPLSYMWVPNKEKKERCAAALEMVWLWNRLNALPNQLSPTKPTIMMTATKSLYSSCFGIKSIFIISRWTNMSFGFSYLRRNFRVVSKIKSRTT